MASYLIYSRLSGVTLGCYEAADPAGALDSLARDAGYSDYTAACRVAHVEHDEIGIDEVDMHAPS